MNATRDTDYVVRPSEQVRRPPLFARNASLWGFPIPADRAKLQGLCDTFINRPARLDYWVVAPYVFLHIAHIRDWSASDPPPEGAPPARGPSRGFLEVREAALWIPLARQSGVAGRAAIYPHYIFADDGVVRATGREVYGMPIDLGDFTMPVDAGGPGSFYMRANLVDTFRPNTRAQKELLLRMVPLAGSDSEAPGASWGSADDAASGAFTLFAGLARQASLVGLDLVCLKQFRDASAPDDACYQSIVVAGLEVATYRRGGVLPGFYELTIKRTDSHPIVDEMGIDRAALRRLRGFYVDMDYSIGLGAEIPAV